MLVWLMLAQAQECAHIKAVADNKSPGILAKLAKQAGSYYLEAYKAVTAGSLNGHFDKTWITHVSIKVGVVAIHQSTLQPYQPPHAMVGTLLPSPTALRRCECESTAQRSSHASCLCVRHLHSWGRVQWQYWSLISLREALASSRLWVGPSVLLLFRSCSSVTHTLAGGAFEAHRRRRSRRTRTSARRWCTRRRRRSAAS